MFALINTLVLLTAVFIFSCNSHWREPRNTACELKTRVDELQTLVDRHNQNLHFNCQPLPDPIHHWDLSGRAEDSTDSGCPSTVNSQLKMYDKVDENRKDGDVSGGVSVVKRGTSGCGVVLGGASSIDFGSFKGNCVSQPELCVKGLTVAFWAKVDWAANGRYLVASGGQTGSSRGMAILWERTSSYINVISLVKTNTKYWQTVFTVQSNHLSPGEMWNGLSDWTHFTMTWQEGEGLSFYVNGIVASVTPNGTPGSFNNLQFTHLTINKPNNVNLYYGISSYSDLKIFESRLTSEEVKVLFKEY